MNKTLDFGWYYFSAEDRAPAWSSVEYFYDFLTGAPAFASRNGGIGPYATEVPMRRAEVGDVAQYADGEGDWYHTVIISKIENGEIYVCAQSNDALDRPLSDYNFAAVRFLHIEGVRFDLNDAPCFSYLISGGELLPMAAEPQPPLKEPLPSEEPRDEGEVPLEEEAPESTNDEAPQPPLGDRPDVVEGS